MLVLDLELGTQKHKSVQFPWNFPKGERPFLLLLLFMMTEHIISKGNDSNIMC